MGLSEIVAKGVAIVGGAAIMMRRFGATTDAPAIGPEAQVPEAKAQGIMTLKMPTAQGFAPGQVPAAASGLKVNALATGLDHPRWMEVLPNGDVLVAEAMSTPGGIRTPFDYAIVATMKRAKATGVSANRITLLRDADGDGVAEHREVFLKDLNQPFGMALKGEAFYVGNTDGIVTYPYDATSGKIAGDGRKITSFKPHGHWTRSLLFNETKSKLYAGVGSLSNIGDKGMDQEEGRAAIYEVDPETGDAHVFAGGLRNAVGMAWEPETGVLWTVVNERDGLGDEVPPDYLTSVREGGFYGWPFCYWGQTVDDRVKQDPALVATAIKPDYALGGHTASLGLCWMPEGTLPGFPDGMVIGQHGSWNRSTLSGYAVIFVPFEGGKPIGPPRDILTGFLAPDEKVSYGRPVGVCIGPDGSLLVADDVADTIWRVTGA